MTKLLNTTFDKYFSYFVLVLLTVSSVHCENQVNIDGFVSLAKVTALNTAANGSNYTNYNFSGTCSHPGQEVSIAEGACGILTSATCGSKLQWNRNLNLTTCSDGTLNFIVSHQNGLGDIETILSSIQKDIVDPATVLSYPLRASQPIGYKVKVQGTCTTADGNVSITVGALPTEQVTCAAGSFTTYVDTSSLSVTNHNLQISQTDAAGNTSSTTLQLSKNFSNCDSLATRQNNFAANLAGGDGSKLNPHIICTADQLNEMRSTTTGHYQLANDIYFESGDTNGDFNVDGGDSDYVTGSGWLPVTSANGFHGQSFTISSLQANRPTTNGVGLFTTTTFANKSFFRSVYFSDAVITGQDNTGVFVGTSQSAFVYDIHCSNCQVTGRDETGGIIGSASSVIAQSTYQGNVTGNDTVGGIAGRTSYTTASVYKGTLNGNSSVGGVAGLGSVANSYAQVNLSATGSVIGGIVGIGDATLSYAEGTITATSPTANQVGCIIGYINNGIASDNIAACTSITLNSNGSLVGPAIGHSNSVYIGTNYYAANSVCTNTGTGSCNSTGTSTPLISDFYNPTHIAYSNWDFRGQPDNGSDIWVEQAGTMPVIYYESPVAKISPLAGAGTLASPYILSTPADLLEVASHPFYQFSYFQLANSIDVGATAAFRGLFRDVPFFGDFNGAGFQIQNMNIVEPSSVYIPLGFMGTIGGDGRIHNLGIQITNLTGSTGIGGVAGVVVTQGTFSRVSVTGGSITSAYHITATTGGLFGFFEGEIQESYSTTNINCNGGRCGGLIGRADRPTISDSYSTGTVNGTAGNTGGFVGEQFTGSYTNCYAAGDVIGSSLTGGFWGGGTGPAPANSFATGNVTGNSTGTDVGPFTGSASSGANSYYWSGATCNNTGTGSCNALEIAEPTLSNFYNSANNPLNTWDFVTIWQQNGGALPTLRNTP